MVGRSGPKERKSVSLDRDLVETIDTQDDLNLSGLVNDLLRAYFEGGGSKNRALRVKREKLDEKAGKLEEELRQIREQRERIEEVLEERQERLDPILSEGVEMVKRGNSAILDPENAMTKTKASNAGITANEYVEKLAARLDGDIWTKDDGLRSTSDVTLTFDADTLRETDDPKAAIQEVPDEGGKVEAQT